jgi:hypothetical protein
MIAGLLLIVGSVAAALERRQALLNAGIGVLAIAAVLALVVPLGGAVAHEFEAKWVHAESVRAEPLLGTEDVQSLADMGRVYTVVQTMRFAPVTRAALVQLLAATLAPIAPCCSR